jgi:PIN domain nuclease of toxin-antitoxin system
MLGLIRFGGHDRMPIAQAMLEPARLLTVDGPVKQYSDLVEIVGP